MSDELSFVTWDVFTTTAFAGNPLAIVTGADDLTTAQMQTIAREFNLSETVFVMAPRDPAHTARLRIFCPTAEIPFAGHPTIGTAIYLAQTAAGDDATILLEEEAGLVPVQVTRQNGMDHSEFRAPVLPFAPEGAKAAAPDLLAAALGLDQENIGLPNHTAAVWEGGPRFLYIPVANLKALAKARPQEPAWSQIMALAQVDSGYLYTMTGAAGLQARMFSPTAGIPEDPATGSAAAILSAQLHAAGTLTAPETRFHISQGVEMGRPSQIGLRILQNADTITDIFVSGTAVPISSGKIRIPN
ncbi:MAG: PhzF family phenazine biosynthesis protein [Paracoccaceae bacterium]|nr:PhzF family phenazine biosynthesis protein [Paracoccaceae bacterium]